MKDDLNLDFSLSGLAAAGASPSANRPFPGAAPALSREPRPIEAFWARHYDDVRAAQRLRFDVFSEEFGARFSTTEPGHDVDLFDNYCEHLLVRDVASRQVIGTYRVLPPDQARRLGGSYTEAEFDLTRLRALRPRMMELGRSCVHRDHRHGAVITALWGALLEFMVRNQFDSMIGCVSVPLLHNGVLSGDAAASMWNQLRQTHLAPIQHHVLPRKPLPLERLDSTLGIDPPALVKAYLRMGAKVLGPPALDLDFNSADLPMLLRLTDLPERYRRRLQGGQ